MYENKDKNVDHMNEGIKCWEQTKKQLLDLLNLLKEVEESNKMILQCLLVIINHDITGNGIDKLKSTRDKLQEYLIEK